MSTRAGRLLVVPALIVLIGAHWGLLQTVAWVGMVMTYSQQTSLGEALEMTFDGEHPCPLCKVVEEGRAEERQQQHQQLTPAKELDLGLPPQVVALAPPPIPPVLSARWVVPDARTEPPPTPPPRNA